MDIQEIRRGITELDLIGWRYRWAFSNAVKYGTILFYLDNCSLRGEALLCGVRHMNKL